MKDKICFNRKERKRTAPFTDGVEVTQTDMVHAKTDLLEKVKTAYNAAMKDLPDGSAPQMKDITPYLDANCSQYVILACTKILGLPMDIRATKSGKHLLEDRVPEHIQKVYDLIEKRYDETGLCLSMRDIQNQLGMSLSTIKNDLMYLAVTGKIDYYHHGCRTIRPIVKQ